LPILSSLISYLETRLYVQHVRERQLESPPARMLACLVGASALGYTAQQGQQGQMKEEVFDPSTCKGVSGTDHDGEWCVANCGKDTNPICPESFCVCEGTMPTPEELGTNDLTPEEKADKKKVDDAVKERDAGFAAAQDERDAAIAKRDEEIAKAAQDQSDRDAEIAKRDADIASRQPEPVAPEPAVAEAAAAAAAAAAAEPSPAAEPAVDWATGNPLPQAPTAAPFPAATIAPVAQQQAAPADPDASPDPWAEAAAAAAKATADAAAAAAIPAGGAAAGVAPTAAPAPTVAPFPEYNAPEESAPVTAPPPAETLGGGSVTAYEGSGLDEPDKHRK